MPPSLNDKLNALDPKISVIQKQFKNRNKHQLNDAKGVDLRVKEFIVKNQQEINQNYIRPLILALFLLLQCIISSGSYSGNGQKPKFGDYEAQRHWMEIAVNLPINEWYFNTTNNDLNYWGLDYPPLTAYHSFIVGKIAQLVNNDWVALHKSRGFESQEHKLFMRLSVILTMLLIYAPAILTVHQYWYCDRKKTKKPTVLLFSMLCFIGLLYVDNGHFQYNHIALGLFLWCFKFLCNGRHIIGSVLFVMVLSFKQMSLYHALPIFVYLFFQSFNNGFTNGIFNVLKLGVTVILTFALIWLPFLTPTQLPQVLHRIFPVARGLFEDKVASFWCAMSPVYKFHQFSMEFMIQISALIVLIVSIPTLLLLARRPNEKNFVYSLFICSMTFFLFSVQVHEKTILFVNIPALFLLSDHSEAMTTFLFISMFSMFPLCVEDGLAQLYPLFVAYYLILLVKLASNESRLSKFLHVLNVFVATSLVLALLLVKPPTRYPHIFMLLIAEYSFVVFSFTLAFVYYKNIESNWSTFFTVSSREKKTN